MSDFDYKKVKDPEYFQENRLPAHSDHVFYPDMEALKRKENSFRYSLNGLWKFAYARNYHSVIKGFWSADYDCRSWEDIREIGRAHV